jgi:glycosyltransferase involved in cell wall biosynthesis
MRVALFDNTLSGGSKREAYELGRALSAHGHVVDLWTTTAADTTFLPMERISRRRVCYRWPAPHPAPVSLPGLRGYLAALEWSTRLRHVRRVSQRMAAHIDRSGYDFVFAHHCQPVQGPYLLRFLRTPSVYYCAEPMRAFYEPPIERPYAQPVTLLDRWQRRWYAPAQGLTAAYSKSEDAANVRQATVLLTNSYFTAESIYRAYGRRALVSYLGVDVECFQPLGLPREGFVLSVGAVSPFKGYDFIVRALGCMAAEGRPPLLIVGNAVSGAEQAYLESMARDRGVSLEVRRNVPEEELVRLYNRARALVYAPVLEPFGFAPLEAMACGTPVVAVAEGGVRESVRDGVTGLLTQRDPRRFAAALTGLLRDEALQARLGGAGVAAVRSFWTWQEAYKRFVDLLQTGLHERRANRDLETGPCGVKSVRGDSS